MSTPVVNISVSSQNILIGGMITVNVATDIVVLNDIFVRCIPTNLIESYFITTNSFSSLSKLSFTLATQMYNPPIYENRFRRQVSFNVLMSRNIPIGETRSFYFEFRRTNDLNSPSNPVLATSPVINLLNSVSPVFTENPLPCTTVGVSGVNNNVIIYPLKTLSNYPPTRYAQSVVNSSISGGIRPILPSSI